jgi:hypothetical protein
MSTDCTHVKYEGKERHGGMLQERKRRNEIKYESSKQMYITKNIDYKPD